MKTSFRARHVILKSRTHSLKILTILTVLLVLFLAVSSSKLFAQNVLSGIGGFSCGQYVKYRDDDEFGTLTHLLESWMLGFISGLNMNTTNENSKTKYDPPDGDSIALYVDKFCNKYPLHHVYLAGRELYKDLGGEL